MYSSSAWGISDHLHEFQLKWEWLGCSRHNRYGQAWIWNYWPFARGIQQWPVDLVALPVSGAVSLCPFIVSISQGPIKQYIAWSTSVKKGGIQVKFWTYDKHQYLTCHSRHAIGWHKCHLGEKGNMLSQHQIVLIILMCKGSSLWLIQMKGWNINMEMEVLRTNLCQTHSPIWPVIYSEIVFGQYGNWFLLILSTRETLHWVVCNCYRQSTSVVGSGKNKTKKHITLRP